MSARLIVIATGDTGEHIASIGDRHAEFDPANRRVLRPGDEDYPEPETIARWARNGVAVVVDVDDRPVIFLNEQRATSESWIEDAFLRGGSGLSGLY